VGVEPDLTPPAMGRMRIATWNLWWHFGPWEERQAAILETMRRVDADVWCLQEVFRSAAGDDQAAELAEGLGGYHVAHGSRFDLSVFPEAIGNAVLSRWPVVGSEVRDLPAPDGLDELRCVLRADLETPFGPRTVYSTHLNWLLDQSDVRQDQVRGLARFVAEGRERSAGDPHPPIVCGDFNADPDSDEIRMLTGLAAVPVRGQVFVDAWRARGAGPGITWDNRNPFAAAEYEPDRRIDYVLVGLPGASGVGQVLEVARFGDGPVAGVWPSDHCGLVATLRA